MKKNASPYSKHLAKGFTFGGSASVWLGPDHLLSAVKQHYTETYKRFYFKDIQMITMTRSNVDAALSILLFVALVISAAIAVANLIVGGILCALSLAALLWNLYLGHTCKCTVYTAVQSSHLKGVNRVRVFRRLLETVQPLIEAEQGAFVPEVTDSGDPLVTRQAPPEIIAVPAREQTDSPSDRVHINRKVHTWVFALMFLMGITLIGDMFIASSIKDLFDSAMYVSEVILAIVAVRRQKDSTMPKELRTATWLSVGLPLCLTILIPFINAVYLGATSDLAANPITYESIVRIQSPDLFPFIAVVGALFIVLAASGMMFLRRYGPPPVSPEPAPAPPVYAEEVSE